MFVVSMLIIVMGVIMILLSIFMNSVHAIMIVVSTLKIVVGVIMVLVSIIMRTVAAIMMLVSMLIQTVMVGGLFASV